ncbi:MAG: aldehyde-activating protein [Alphaproteobacteria bacterium]|nr:MAG: aldehyde-activating protein [Alphaproteobacteria bacterium]
MAKKFENCEGGCTCGHVRYKVSQPPLIVHACHCRWCQRQTGGPHVVNALYEAELIELTSGEVEVKTVPSPSGEGQIIARCPSCRIAVWSNYDFGGMREQVRFLRVGTLDNPDLMPPDVHIFTSTKVPWYIIPPKHLAVKEFYDSTKVWSPESQQRYRKWKEATD